MSKNGFTIICNKCGNTIDVRDETSNKDYKESTYYFLPVQSDSVNICCGSCENEVYISKD